MGGEVDLQRAWQLEVVVSRQNPDDTALARLASDPGYRAVALAEVGRIDRQIGHLPESVVAVSSCLIEIYCFRSDWLFDIIIYAYLE